LLPILQCPEASLNALAILLFSFFHTQFVNELF